MAGTPNAKWTDADAYQAYIGRWSAVVAPKFLAWLDAPRRGRWLDIGCGPGTLTLAILAEYDPAQAVGVDPSPAFVEGARSRVSDPRASFAIGTAESLPPGLTLFDAVVAGLVLNFVPDKAAAVTAMTAAARPGGVVGAYVWDYGEGMQLLRHFWDAAADLDPAAVELDEGRRFPDFGNRQLPELFAAELDDVASDGIVVDTRFATFDDYWRPFTGGQGPAPTYAMSLDEDRRAALQEHIRSRLPIAADGSIALTARAWAVRGRRRS